MLLDLDRFDVLMLPFARAMCPAKRDGEYGQQAFDPLAMGNMSINLPNNYPHIAYAGDI